MDSENPIRKAKEVREQTRDLVAGFLKVEVGVSLTFAEAALNSDHDSQKRLRNQAAARKGYDTIHRYLRKFGLSVSPGFKEELDRLKAALEELGETELHDGKSSQHP